MYFLRKLRKEKGITMKELGDVIGFAESTVSQYETGKRSPDFETLLKLGEFFGVSVDYLLTGENAGECYECGVRFNPHDAEQVAEHDEIHRKWDSAVKKFGFCWNHIFREKMKHANRQILNDKSNDFSIRYGAAINVIKAYFSRSIEQADYNLSHVPFEEYIAYFLYSQENADSWKENLDVYNELVQKYEKKIGMNGTNYYKSTTSSIFSTKIETKQPATPQDDELPEQLKELASIWDKLGEDERRELLRFAKFQASERSE